jgi:TetR/AcrR family transcriptional regulator
LAIAYRRFLASDKACKPSYLRVILSQATKFLHEIGMFGPQWTMPKITRRPQHDETTDQRAQIRGAALEVFSIWGFERATTRQIAAAAGIQQGHLAYYYPSKEALWREVLVEFNVECAAVLENALATAKLRSSESRARAVLPALLRYLARNPRLTRIMMQEFSVSSPRHDWVIETFAQPIWLRLRPLFEALERDGWLGGANAAVSYFTLVTSTVATFGSSGEIRKISGLNMQNEAAIEQHIAILVRTVLSKRVSDVRA